MQDACGRGSQRRVYVDTGRLEIHELGLNLVRTSLLLASVWIRADQGAIARDMCLFSFVLRASSSLPSSSSESKRVEFLDAARVCKERPANSSRPRVQCWINAQLEPKRLPVLSSLGHGASGI